MWATAPSLSALPVDRASRRKKSGGSSAPTSPPLAPPTQQMPTFSQNLADLLEPAVDGPPSPESIRALSQQMRQTSAAQQDKHHSRQTTSSGSSSLRSLASLERPSWEHAFDSPTASGTPPLPSLSRKSSGHSTSSSMPSRPERTESVQIFSKSIFARKGKLRRESSVQSSASSSLYSVVDMPPDPVSPPLSAGSIIPSIFSRRKTMRPESIMDESSSDARRRLQISGPYNFQHLTHTQKENIPNLQRTSRMALQSEFMAIRASQVPTTGTLKGIHAESIHFADFSAENLPVIDGGSASAGSSRVSLGRLNRSFSQDQLRMPPPRPFRPSDDPEFGTPVVPPRVSSRLSVSPCDGAELINDDQRPEPGGSLREMPRLPSTLEEEDEQEDAEDGLQMRRRTRTDRQGVPADYRYSRVISSAPDDLNWPLTTPLSGSFETGVLPDVPEEEESTLPVKSRASITSNSSLKGSQSVPMLRNLLTSTSKATSQRPPSNSSDTLGRFDLLAAQRSLRAALAERDSGAEELTRESWEDDIDYCYEHEVEADCDYAWDRPSFDSSRGDESATPVELGVGSSRSDVSASSPTMLNPGRFDVPALSPASQASTSAAVEAITPTTAPANFSKPQFQHAHKPSHASTFKESHGFNLSPTLLIPGSSEYHRQMMLHEEPEWYPGQDELNYVPPYEYNEPVLTMDKSALFIQSRTSASTVDTLDSEEPLGSDRHVSTASDSTALTRLTQSSSSVNMAGLAAAAMKEDASCPPPPSAEGAPFSSSSPTEAKSDLSITPTHTRGQSEPLSASRPCFEMNNNPFDEAFAATSRPTTASTQRNFSHIMPTSPVKTKDDTATTKLVKRRKEPAPVYGRPRAKTTSLASPSSTFTAAYSPFPAVNIAVSRM